MSFDADAAIARLESFSGSSNDFPYKVTWNVSIFLAGLLSFAAFAPLLAASMDFGSDDALGLLPFVFWVWIAAHVTLVFWLSKKWCNLICWLLMLLVPFLVVVLTVVFLFIVSAIIAVIAAIVGLVIAGAIIVGLLGS